MGDKLFFKTDPLTGNKKFRSEIVFILAIVLGIGVWIALETKGNGKDAVASTELNLQTGVIAAVGEQQIGINEDMRNLVSTAPQVPEVMPEGDLNTAALVTPNAKTSTTTAKATTITTSKPKTSFGIDVHTPAAKAAPETESKEGLAPPKPVDWDALQKQAESPSSSSGSGSSSNSYVSGNNSSGATKSGSAVAFKREDDKSIQNRDGQQFDNLPGLPAGTIIPCEILTGIISGDTLPVIFYVTKDVLYNQAVVIPKGSLFLGTAEANFASRRIFVTIERLIIGNAEIKVTGQVQDGAGRAGLMDRYVDNSTGTLIAGFFTGLLSEFGKAFSAKSSLVQIGGDSSADAAKGAFLSGTSSGLDSVATTLAEKAAAQKAVMIAYPNKNVRIMMEQKIPLEWLLKANGK